EQHSFPTRRSSDLIQPSAPTLCQNQHFRNRKPTSHHRSRKNLTFLCYPCNLLPLASVFLINELTNWRILNYIASGKAVKSKTEKLKPSSMSYSPEKCSSSVSAMRRRHWKLKISCKMGLSKFSPNTTCMMKKAL